MTASLPHAVNLVGEEYYDLIEWCFRHATAFSLKASNPDSEMYDVEKEALKILEPHAVLRTDTKFDRIGLLSCFDESVDCIGWASMILYRCCKESKKYFLEKRTALYNYSNDEKKGLYSLQDPCFYLRNQQTLLYTVEHESICWISHQKENVLEELKSKEKWVIDDTETADSFFFDYL